jgi:hypothetical protein
MEALMAFAEAQHANLVLLPEELDDPSLVDRVRGDTLEDASEASEVPIKVVSRRHGADGSRAD